MLFEMTFVKQWTRCGYDYIICCCWSHITAHGTRSNWLSFLINHVLFFMWICVESQPSWIATFL